MNICESVVGSIPCEGSGSKGKVVPTESARAEVMAELEAKIAAEEEND
jgi:hypothetical protein